MYATQPAPAAYVQTVVGIRDWLRDVQGITFEGAASGQAETFDLEAAAKSGEKAESSIGSVLPLAWAKGDGSIVAAESFAAQPRAAWTILVTAHELLHTSVTGGADGRWYVAGRNPNLNNEAALAQEQVVDATMLDFAPYLLQQRFGWTLKAARAEVARYARAAGYRGLIVRIRKWSAKQCGCPWTDPRAQVVREQVLMQNPEDRRILG